MFFPRIAGRRIALAVLLAIKFDNNFGFDTGKVGNCIANRMLAPKTEAAELSFANKVPAPSLGRGHVLAKCASIGVWFSH